MIRFHGHQGRGWPRRRIVLGGLAVRGAIISVVALTLLLTGCGGGSGGGGGTTTVKKSTTSCTTASVVNDPSAATDVLAPYLWYLNLTGATQYFSSGSGNLGEDISHDASTYDGTDVTVAIVDTGVEIRHEDLKDRLVADTDGRISHNFNTNTADPSPTGCEGDHGTSVTGLAVATKDNNLGGYGVAPGAQFVGYNFSCLLCS